MPRSVWSFSTEQLRTNRARYVLGDLREQTFREVWHSEAYTEFRRTLLTARSSIEMCRNCSEGSPVWA